MKNTEQVKNALDMLRQADAGSEAPVFLETRLCAAFREKHAVPAPVVVAAPWWSAWRNWAGIAFASVALAAVVYRAATPGSVEAPTPKPPATVAKQTPPPIAEQTAPAPGVAEPAAPEPSSVAQTPRRSRSLQAGRPARPSEPLDVTAASAREGDEFLAIPFAPPMLAQDRGEVVRVRLPRQSLRQFGIPVNPERLLERVPADVLVGEDGIPRGIRFIRTGESR